MKIKLPHAVSFLIFCNCFLLSLNTFAQTLGTVLNTLPSEAEVLDLYNKKIGVTPFNLSNLPLSTEGFKVFKTGYDTTRVLLYEGKKKEITFPTSVSFCEPACAINFTSTDPKKGFEGVLKLRKTLLEYDYPIMVAIDTPQISIALETELGRVNSDKKKLKDSDIHQLIGYAENMNVQAVSAFNDSYLIANYYTLKGDDKTTLYKPKIILKPVINNLSFSLKGRLLRDYAGPCTMECVWEVSTINNPKKILHTIPITTSIYRTTDNYELILHQMIYESELDLLANDSLYDLLLRLQQNYLALTKGSVIKIKCPAKTSYASSKEMLKNLTAPVVTIESAKGFGSGVIISDDGFILTNYHVIQDSTNLKVRIGIDKKIKATIIKTNSDYDLALLKIDAANAKALPLGKSKDAQSGDEVYAVGTPLEKTLSQTITKGIVSGTRQWNGVEFLQTDVSINAGNSGGPLVNDKGEVIGITTMKLFGKGIEGIGFCIPIDEAIEMLNLQFGN